MPRARRIREAKPDRIARTAGVPAAQLGQNAFTIVDVANHSEADQRHAVRSRQMRTVRRKPKLMQLYDARVLTLDGYKACLWYHDLHALGYDTLGITANYGGGVGGGQTSFTHFARYHEQGDARNDYMLARAGIDRLLLPLLERVVLHGRPIGRLAISFRRAVDQLVERAESMGAISS